jgi:protein-S-isoprenylcysteine O-methyltransferase Ste14
MHRLSAFNLLINAMYYGITVVALPWSVLKVEAALRWPHYPSALLSGIALILGMFAVSLQAWAIVTLQTQGGGTPSPARPPRHLVQAGPYAWLRNPLNVGEVALLAALAAWFGSPGLAAYALLAALAFHLFIVFWEEPRHRALFGPAFDDYRARVSRWIPQRQRAPRPRPAKPPR